MKPPSTVSPLRESASEWLWPAVVLVLMVVVLVVVVVVIVLVVVVIVMVVVVVSVVVLVLVVGVIGQPARAPRRHDRGRRRASRAACGGRRRRACRPPRSKQQRLRRHARARRLGQQRQHAIAMLIRSSHRRHFRLHVPLARRRPRCRLLRRAVRERGGRRRGGCAWWRTIAWRRDAISSTSPPANDGRGAPARSAAGAHPRVRRRHNYFGRRVQYATLMLKISERWPVAELRPPPHPPLPPPPPAAHARRRRRATPRSRRRCRATALRG